MFAQHDSGHFWNFYDQTNGLQQIELEPAIINSVLISILNIGFFAPA